MCCTKANRNKIILVCLLILYVKVRICVLGVSMKSIVVVPGAYFGEWCGGSE